MIKALVLGGGRVGAVIAADLASDERYQVTVADAATLSINGVRCELHDCSNATTITQLARDYDVVLGALPSTFGLMALEAVIDAGRPYCDISFMPDDPRVLDEKAKAKGVVALVDFGVAPGMSHLLAARGERLLDESSSVQIYVGGLPKERRWPYEYKAGFAPTDVIEEYTRPARFIENGQLVQREALSEPELLHFPGIGTLEAFNTDGLRSGLDTLSAPDRIEKTLRYPGHIELMRVLRHTKFFSQQAIEVPTVDGETVRIRPLDLTAKLLFPLWAFDEGEPDVTVMRILVRGKKKGLVRELRWDLHDEFDAHSGWTSMSRTTGFPCAIAGRLLAERRIKRPGVYTAEALADDPALVQTIVAELAKRGVHYRFSEHDRASLS